MNSGYDAGLDNHLSSLGNGTGNEYVLTSINPVHGPGTITVCPRTLLTCQHEFQIQAYGDTGDRLVNKSNCVVFLMGNLAGTAVSNLTNVDSSHFPVVRVNGTTAAFNSTTPVAGPMGTIPHHGPYSSSRSTTGRRTWTIRPCLVPSLISPGALGSSIEPAINPQLLLAKTRQAISRAGVTPFLPPSITMPLGINLAQPNAINYWGYCATKNARYRCSGPVADAGTTVLVGTDGAGANDPTLPYSWTPGGSFHVFYWNTGNGNGIETGATGQIGYPGPVGHHSRVWDDVNAGTSAQLVATLLFNSATCTATLIGTTVVGNTVTTTYDCPSKASDGNGNNLTNGYNLGLFWKFSSTVGKWAKDNTITNYWAFAPGDEYNDRSVPLAMTLRLLTLVYQLSKRDNGLDVILI